MQKQVQPTNRNKIISQLRYALGRMTSPLMADDTIIFEIVDTEFELSSEFLDTVARD